MSLKLFQLLLNLWLIALTPTVLSTGSQRWQGDNSVRGNSFGLENFLFQSYDDAEISKVMRDVKKIRPAGEYNTIEHNNRLQFEPDRSSIVGFITTHPPLTNNFNRNYQAQNLPANIATLKTVTPPQRVSIDADITENKERITKTRPYLRRRKRPQQLAPENKNWKSNRIPDSTPPSRVSVRTTAAPIRASDSSKPHHYPTPVSIKSSGATSTLRPQQSQEERVQEITKLTEDSTAATRVRDQTGAKRQQQPTKVTTEKTSTMNLKDFLKQQTETLRLSELLQTQNLSLADLLKGNKDASAILRVSTTPASIFMEVKKKYHSPELAAEPSESKYRKTEIPQKAVTLETTTFKTLSKRVQQKFTGVSVNHTTKNHENSPEEKETTEETIKTSKRTNLYTLNPLNLDSQNRINDFRAKLRNGIRRIPTREPQVTTQTPEKITTTSTEPTTVATKVTEPAKYKTKRIPFKSSNNPELSLIITDKKSELREKYPDRITSRLPYNKKTTPEIKVKQSDNLVIEPPKPQNSNSERESESVEDSSQETETATVTTQSYEYVTKSSEEVKKPEMKDDLIELLRSQYSADALKKILDSRNMTLEEVLQNREKSTVQSNIEELFSSRQMNNYTTPLSIEIVEPKELNPHKIDLDDLYQSESGVAKGSIIIGQADIVETREGKHYSLPIATIHEESVLNFKPDDLRADTSNTENLALWKLSDKAVIYGSTFPHQGPLPVKRITDKPSIHRSTELPDDEDGIILLETLERHQDAGRKLKMGLNDYRESAKVSENMDKSYIPPAIKSAIIASGVVMGLALFVFIAIFATCGWRQRRVRLKGSSSILNETLTRSEEKPKLTNTLTPVNFNDGKTYKKTIEFDDGTSESGTSIAGSYLWNSLKNTFTSRANTLKGRLDRETKSRDDKLTYRGNESKKKFRHEGVEDSSTYEIQEEKTLKKIDRGRNVINTSFNFKRSTPKDQYFSDVPRRC
ncbi:hypothetical protein RUM44_009635 [Polyplax serrata]|uniref:Uncharacterized protein n=1 Tax=Polyplax serrata TaxID=468196 RepID=A0ABR1AUQ1_POLSC